MSAFYNENDPKTAAWLRELIAGGHIAPGVVDERSISDISPKDLDGFTQCHFFAGIGGWPLAFRLAGWPDDEPVWSGSCPCQPFSDAGIGLGESDPRHLWPVWFPLIRKRGPATVFGEQVASKAALRWLDGVFTDLEGEDYACGASDLCAASVQSPQIRQRIYWVGNAASERRNTFGNNNDATKRPEIALGAGGLTGGLANAHGGNAGAEGVSRGGQYRQQPKDGEFSGLADSMREGRAGQPLGLLGPSGEGYWSKFDILPCLDGKARRVEPGTFPLAHGVSGRVGLLRGYGNAIVPQVAAQFIQAFIEATT